MVSLAVLYNIIFVMGRSVFWEINRKAPAVWYTLDYLCDFIYLLDTLVHMHEGTYGGDTGDIDMWKRDSCRCESEITAYANEISETFGLTKLRRRQWAKPFGRPL